MTVKDFLNLKRNKSDKFLLLFSFIMFLTTMSFSIVFLGMGEYFHSSWHFIISLINLYTLTKTFKRIKRLEEKSNKNFMYIMEN